MTSHKEQPAVDTSAEKLLALAGRVRSYLNLQGGIQLTTLLQDCDATLRSLAAHPAEPVEMELETTAEERKEWSEHAIHPTGFVARLLRDFDRMRARAEKAEAYLAASDKRVAELEAEVARKDEALRAIDQRRYADRSTVTPDNAFAAFGKLNSAVIEIYDIARAALAPRNETGGKEEKAT